MRTDIVTNESFSATLGFGPPRPLPNAAGGTLTWAPDPGVVVEFGDTLFELDERPVILFEGDTPTYRTLEPGIRDGDDVEQLEAALARVGFTDRPAVTVDRRFTAATSRAVRLWQDALDVEETGRVDFGFVVFSPTPLRVEQGLTEIGEQSSGAVLAVTSSDPFVTVTVPAERVGSFSEGGGVEISMPDGSIRAGFISDVPGVAVESPIDGSPVVDVAVSFESGDRSQFVAAPVKVTLADVAASDVLVVPVAALLALSPGGYGVEVVEGESSRVVNVELGEFGEGLVAISGSVSEGDLVVIPS